MEERLKDGDWLVRREQDRREIRHAPNYGGNCPRFLIRLAFTIIYDNRLVRPQDMRLRDNSVLETAISGN